ncbi:MAG: hypothetical protein A2381_00350 [Bdellovibrionales bacterium RIFOXYB1_FULL_37_110]|nr:MAG: hypothetical protein A2417_11405 [Bdellovibrionales bacterium RIFOXYC1_FULL_37_79]OFZ60844.1 MAG: hypothetical protein A2381_00350 [Bdellovibrionales bacterium RIFOXYB1_FULL_37_110]OFZ62374.1 MAG: hypothetical protein A2577_03015 [Bdellovibrionales bacterium RIFOXYD1_FULL_36_51]
MKPLWVLLLISLTIHPSFAAGTFYRPNKHFPLEFIYLMNSIQSKPASSAETSVLSKQLKSFDQLASDLEVEKNHLFIKSEIYKVLFKLRPKSELSKESYQEEILTNVKNKLSEDSKSNLSAFTVWFIEALITDITLLFSSEHFKPIQLVVTAKQALKNDKEKNYKKKLDLCLAWIELYLNLNAEEFEIELFNVMNKIIERLYQYSNLYLQLTHTGTASLTNELVHFSLSEKQPDKKGIANINYILDLENMGLDKDRPREPKLDWLPSDEPFNANIPKSKEDNKKQPPDEKEPVPINDWPIDIE